MSNCVWYLAGEGEQVVGPLSEEKILEQLKAGSLSTRQYCCREGMPAWQELAQVEPFAAQIAALSKVAKPPLPPLPAGGTAKPSGSASASRTPKGVIVVVAVLAALLWLSHHSSQSVNLSDPKSAARSFIRAVIDGDVQRMLAAADTTKDTLKEEFQVLADMGKAANKFEQACRARFPEASVQASKAGAMFKQGIRDQAMKELDDAKVKIEGDTATIELNGEPTKLKKMKGSWKVDVSSMRDLPKANEVAKMKKQVEAINRMADDIRSGKIKTQEQLAEALIMMESE
jgi:hypothetical protein